MFRTSGKTVGLVAAAALSLALMGSAATAQLTVDIRDRAELERKEIPVNSKKKIALTAQASGGSGLTFQWELLGVGSLGDVTKSAIFYFPPTTIDGDTDQAIITIRVKDADGNEAQSGITLTIVGGGGDRPTPEPTATPTEEPDCTSIKADGEIVKFHSVVGQKWSKEWKNWGWAITTFSHAKKQGASEAFVQEVWDDRYGLWRFNIKSPELHQAVFLNNFVITIGSCWKKVDTLGSRDSTTGHIIEKTIIYLRK